VRAISFDRTNQHQRREAAATGVRIVSERNGCLLSAACCGSALFILSDEIIDSLDVLGVERNWVAARILSPEACDGTVKRSHFEFGHRSVGHLDSIPMAAGAAFLDHLQFDDGLINPPVEVISDFVGIAAFQGLKDTGVTCRG
jgi:hypothetical protein